MTSKTQRISASRSANPHAGDAVQGATKCRPRKSKLPLRDLVDLIAKSHRHFHLCSDVCRQKHRRHPRSKHGVSNVLNPDVWRVRVEFWDPESPAHKANCGPDLCIRQVWASKSFIVNPGSSTTNLCVFSLVRSKCTCCRLTNRLTLLPSVPALKSSTSRSGLVGLWVLRKRV